MKIFVLNSKAKLIDYMREYCKKRFQDEKDMFAFAYNFYFGLKRDATDLDAGCILSILHGEMIEGTYAMMKRQCSDVLKICTKLDVDSTDCISKSQFLKKLGEHFPLKKRKHFESLVMRVEKNHSGSEIYYNQLLELNTHCAACGFLLELQQQVIEEQAIFVDLWVRPTILQS
jgi:hypothetical protein